MKLTSTKRIHVTKLTSIRWVAGLAFLLLTHMFTALAAEPHSLPAQIESDLCRFSMIHSNALPAAFANNVPGRFSVEITPGQAAFGLGPGSGLLVTLRGLGRSDQGQSYPATGFQIDGNAVRSGTPKSLVQEEWLNTPAGLKQTFTVARSLPGAGELRCLADVQGARSVVTPEGNIGFEQNGAVVFEARDLKVWDANHHPLSSRFEARQGGFAIVVNDAGAAYPITVDPLFARRTDFTLEGTAVTLAMDDNVLLVGVPNWNVKPDSDLVGAIAKAAGEMGTAHSLSDIGGSTWANLLKGALTDIGWIDNTIYNVGVVFAYHNISGKWEFRDALQRWSDAIRYTSWEPPTYSEEGSRFGASVAVGGGSVLVGSPGFKYTKYVSTIFFGSKFWSGPFDVGAVEFFAKPNPAYTPNPFSRIGRFREIALDGTSADAWSGNGLKVYQRFGEKVAMTPSFAVVASGRTVDPGEAGILGVSLDHNDPYTSCKLHYFRYTEGAWRRDVITKTSPDSGWPIQGVGVLGDDQIHDVLFLASDADNQAWSLYLKPDPWANQSSDSMLVATIPAGGQACSLAVFGRKAVVGSPGTGKLFVYDFATNRTWTTNILGGASGIAGMGASVALNTDFILTSSGTNKADLIGWRLINGAWQADPTETANSGRATLAVGLSLGGDAAVVTQNGGNSDLSVRAITKQISGVALRNGVPTPDVRLRLRRVTEITPFGWRGNDWSFHSSGPYPVSQGDIFFNVPGDLGNVYTLKLIGQYAPGSDQSDLLFGSAVLPLQRYDENEDGMVSDNEYGQPGFGGSGSVGNVSLTFRNLFGPGWPLSISTAGRWEVSLNNSRWRDEWLSSLKLQAESELPAGADAYATTGADGRFLFKGLPAGSYVVEAMNNYAGQTDPVPLFSTSGQEISMPIRGNLHISGHITANSYGVAGVTVQVIQGSTTNLVTTDDYGLYTSSNIVSGAVLVIPVGPYSFNAASRSFTISAQGDYPYGSGDFQVQPNQTLAFQVQGANSNALAATVSITGPYGYQNTVTAGANGLISLSNVYPGTYQLLGVDARYEWPREALAVTLPATNIVLRSIGGGITLRFTLAGDAHSNAIVTLRRVLSQNTSDTTASAASVYPVKDLTTVTQTFYVDIDGAIEGGALRLKPDGFSSFLRDAGKDPRDVILVHPNGYQVSLGSLPCSGRNWYEDLVVDISAFTGLPARGTWTLRRIFDAPLNDRSIGAAAINIRCATRTYGTVFNSTSDANGRCGFYNLASGTYEVEAFPNIGWGWIYTTDSEKARWTPTRLRCDVSTGVVLDQTLAFTRNNQISGTVRTGTNAVPQMPLVLTDTATGKRLTARTDANGAFLFPVVLSSRYTLASADPSFTCSPAAVDLGAVRADATNLLIKASPSGRIAGRLLDAGGHPLAGERLRLIPSRKTFSLPAPQTQSAPLYWAFYRFPLNITSKARIADVRVIYTIGSDRFILGATGIEAGDGYQRRMFAEPTNNVWSRTFDGAYGEVADPYSEWVNQGIHWNTPVDTFAGFKGRSMEGVWNFFACHKSIDTQNILLNSFILDVDSWRSDSDNQTREVLTGEDGRYEFTGLGPAFFTVEHIPGSRYVSYPRSQVVDASLTPTNVVFEGREQVLAGTVNYDTVPVAGAVVVISGDSGSVHRVLTDAQGHYSYTNSVRENLRIKVEDSLRWIGSEGVFIALDFDGSTPVDLNLVARETPVFSVSVASLTAPEIFEPRRWFALGGVPGKLTSPLLSRTPFAPGVYSVPCTFEATGTDRYLAVSTNVTVQIKDRALYPLFFGASNNWTARYPFQTDNNGNLRAATLGGNFGVGLRAGGDLFAWTFGTGTNTSGTNIPAGLGPVRAVAAGLNHAVAILTNGSVRCWGVADGTAKLAATNLNAKAIAAGSRFSAVLRTDGAIDLYGLLAGSNASPHQIAGPFVGITAANEALVAWKADGTVQVFGSPGNVVVSNLPAGLSGVVYVTAGRSHALALLTTGKIVAWGSDTAGQVSGLPDSLEDVVMVAAGGNGSIALTRSGSVSAWGSLTGQTIPSITDGLGAVCSDEFGLLEVSSRRALEGDLDNDGLVDSIDPDIDNDGVPNELDAFPFDPRETGDNDHDSIGDVADQDDDNDGVLDGIELRFGSNPLDPNSKPARTMVVGYGGVTIPALDSNVVDFDASPNAMIFLFENGRAKVVGGSSPRFLLLEAETNLVQVASGNRCVMGLRANGTIAFYGDDASYDTWFFRPNNGTYYSTPGTPQGVQSIRARGYVAGWVTTNGTIGALEYNPSSPAYWNSDGTYVVMAAARLTPPARQIELTPSYITIVRPDGSVATANYTAAYAVPQPPADLPPVVQVVIGAEHTAILTNGVVRYWGSSAEVHPPTNLPPLVSLEAKDYGTLGIDQQGALHLWGFNYNQTMPAALPSTNVTGFIKAQVISTNRIIGLRQLVYAVSLSNANTNMGTLQPVLNQEVPPGTNMVITAQPKPGYVFAGWEGSFTNQPASFTWTATSNITARALFAQDTADPDQDSLSNYQEIVLYNTDPNNPDSDGDSVPDGAEIQRGLNPLVADTDNDGVSDAYDPYPLDFRKQVADAIPTLGRIIAWGNNGSGQTQIPARATNVIQVAASDRYSMALTSAGEVLAWGYNSDGQTDVPDRAKSHIVKIAAGDTFAMALTDAGEVIAWGWNQWGACNVPVEAQTGVIAIAAGWNHALALKSNGQLLAWGYNGSGVSTIPAAARTGVIDIAANYLNSMALLANGRAVVWGDNYYGQANVPTAALSGIRAIAINDSDSFAVTTNGGVIAWGSANYSLKTIPAAATTNVAYISAGGSHVLAIKTTGELVAWGFNYFGQANVPAAASANVLMADAGIWHSIALVGYRTVQGTLVDDAGQPLPRTLVKAVVGGVNYQTYTDDSGGFLFRPGTSESATFSLSHPDYRTGASGWTAPAGATNVSNLILHALPKLVQTITNTFPTQLQVGDTWPLPSATASGLPLILNIRGQGTTGTNGQFVAGPTSGFAFVEMASPGDDTYKPVSTLAQIAVVKRPQAIQFQPPGSAYSGDPLTLSATTDSGLPVTLTVLSGPATLSNNTLTFSSNGPVLIKAVQAGNDAFEAASPVIATIYAQSTRAGITFTGLDFIFDGLPKAALLVTNPVGMPISVTYDGSAEAPTLPGAYTVTVSFTNESIAGTATGTLHILTNFVPAFAEATNGVIHRTYQTNSQAHPALANEPAGSRKIYRYEGTARSGTAYGPAETAPVHAGQYTVRVTVGNGQSAGIATAAFTIDRAPRTLGWSNSSIPTGTNINLTERLTGADGGSARFEVLSGPATQSEVLTAWGSQGSVDDPFLGPVSTHQLDLPDVPGSQVQDVQLNRSYGLMLTQGSVREWGGYYTYTLPDDATNNITAIAAGLNARAAITADKRLVRWGETWMTEGSFDLFGGGYTPPQDLSEPPARVQGHVTAVALAKDWGTVLLDTGEAVDWGKVPVYTGNLGYWDPTMAANYIAHPEGLPRITALSSSWDHMVALDENGGVHAWGLNFWGGCDVPAEAGSGVVAIFAGFARNYALKADGSWVGWGMGWAEWDDAAQGLVDPLVEPASLPPLAQFACADKSTAVLTTNGTVIGWGRSPLSSNDVSAAAATGPVKWIRAGTDFMVAKIPGNGLTASDNGTIRVKVTVTGSDDYLPGEAVLELQSDQVRLTTDGPLQGGQINGLGNYSPGATATLGFTPDAGMIPLAWVIDGQTNAPNPNRTVTVHPGLTISALFGAAGEDADHDGQLNISEYALGSNPLDPQSRASGMIIAFRPGSGDLAPHLSFATVADSGLRYQVLAASTLAGPWMPVSTTQGDGLPRNITPPIALGVKAAFYQLQISRPY